MNRKHLISPWLVSLIGMGLISAPVSLMAEDTVFSGPQPGESTTPFKSVYIVGEQAGQERDLIEENKGAPTTIVFIHALERSIVPLMKAVDGYGAKFPDKLKTEFVFLAEEKITGMQRYSAALNSLRPVGKSSLSVDGIEGPGNYGLNKECMMTILVAKENKVHANFALTQPGIADAEKVIGAIAKLIGDENPPTAEELKAEQNQGMRRPNMRNGDRAAARPNNVRPNARDAGTGDAPAKDPFPGAVPTDDKLQGMMRQFIRKTNDDATIDRLVLAIRDYIKDDEDLTQQTIEGWKRILHFKDRYGTPYAVQEGEKLLKDLQDSVKKD